MLKYKGVLLFILVIGLLLFTDALAQSPSLRGKVRWVTGAPAIGLEVKIQQNNRVVAITYTNERGLYAFFNINTPLHGVVVIVSDSYRVLKEKRITGDGSNEKIPDIVIE